MAVKKSSARVTRASDPGVKQNHSKSTMELPVEGGQAPGELLRTWRERARGGVGGGGGGWWEADL